MSLTCSCFFSHLRPTQLAIGINLYDGKRTQPFVIEFEFTKNLRAQLNFFIFSFTSSVVSTEFKFNKFRISSKLDQLVSSLGMCVVRVQVNVLFELRDMRCSNSRTCVVRVL